MSTLRTGMSNLITELRGMTEAGTADYSVTSSTYWSDVHLQDALDDHRKDIIFEPLQMYPVTVSSGSSSYKDYRASMGMFEATTGGTDIFYVQDSSGSVAGSANYTPDYRRGQIQFTNDQRGTVYYLTARSYDLNSAAADVWRKKAAHVAPTSFDFSTDNHSINRSQVYTHCLEMADFFESKSNNSVTSVQSWRSDVN
jgi:hypothetical protein